MARSKLVARLVGLTALSVTVACGLACKKSGGNSAQQGSKMAIQNIGSDTMVNIAQAWAEQYGTTEPGVSVEVSGGGSGIGIAALINGTADIANASRRLEPEEAEKVKGRSGSEAKEYMIGYDALSIYVHKDNPLDAISIEELSDIYREGGSLDKWAQLGVTSIPGAKGDNVIRVSRQNNSGTYHYFREAVIGKKGGFRAGSYDMNGSKDVVDLVAKTPNAIGYAGLGYATPTVKILKVAKTKGGTAVMPSIQTTLDRSYPIARPMFMYTPGTPPAHVQKYLDWILSDAGQKVVAANGYIPLEKK